MHAVSLKIDALPFFPPTNAAAFRILSFFIYFRCFFGGGQTMEEMLPDLAAGANVVNKALSLTSCLYYYCYKYLGDA